MWWLYELCVLIGFVCYLPSALWRRRLPHEGWSMRLGRYPRELVASLQGKRTLWVHAVSVGEVLSARPLLTVLTQTYPDAPLVLSTITPGGFEVGSTQVERLGACIYFPLDLRSCVHRAFAAFHPRILLLMESELWPMTVHLAHRAGIPIVVVNGRISPRTFRRAQWVQPFFTKMLHRVDLFLMQSQEDADRLLALGAPAARVHVAGNLKWDASLTTRPTPQAIQESAARFGLHQEETVIVAGSTHRGEEAVLLRAFRAIRTASPQVRLMLAPRHLERVAEVETLIRQEGWMVARASSTPTAGWDVGLIDVFGQLPQYYGLASVVYIGGSLIPHGGQNPLEAASLGKPMVFGPSMHNFASITHQLFAHHAARQVNSADELTQTLQELLAHPREAQAMGARAQALTEQFQGATQRTLNALKPFLTPSSSTT